MRKINTRNFVRATRGTAREINRRIVLNLVREHQPISRADLARRMRIGRGMVTSLVTELLTDGSIYEGSTAQAPRGRKPMMLFVRTHDRLAVAVDVRFSRTYLMLSDFSGKPIALEEFETVPDPAALVANLARRIQKLLKAHAAKSKVNGIGLVLPGMVDTTSGRVLNAPQLGWRDVDVRAALEKATDLPVHVENAPIACALAQMWLGDGDVETPRDFVYLTVGDGVGTGVVVNGEVVRGHDNTAGEFGHVPLNPNGPRCLCGARGCLEAYASNLATLSRYLGHEFSPTETRRLLQESGLTILDVIARARDGERRAIEAIDETAARLGEGLAIVINTLNPSRIFVGGEITELWDRVEPVMRAKIRERALTAKAAETPLVPEPASSYPRLRGGTAIVAAPVYAAPQVA
ncbi:MAG TPA: ROK family protein [Gemmatimonadaceae bacterium]|jgi:predicted NBD/HSP70 family sugar kinase|nr:ROK family protein [Gemmatimonadaceae bacterium]